VSTGKKHKRHAHQQEQERERYYLFPGQGGRNYWVKQRRFILWACAVAIVGGAIFGAIMVWIYRMRPS
jgi:oxalate decarboxylase/phosphoglucose isomerase-like protein (cupin superfamily)